MSISQDIENSLLKKKKKESVSQQELNLYSLFPSGETISLASVISMIEKGDRGSITIIRDIFL